MFVTMLSPSLSSPKACCGLQVWHHLAALVVYIAVYQKPGTLTAASLTPWSLHAIFWTIHTFTPVSTDSLMWLLVLYNLSLYAVGGICLDCWLRLGPSVMPKAAAFGEQVLQVQLAQALQHACSNAEQGLQELPALGTAHKAHTRACQCPSCSSTAWTARLKIAAAACLKP